MGKLWPYRKINRFYSSLAYVTPDKLFKPVKHLRERPEPTSKENLTGTNTLAYCDTAEE
jgi:hypothetical protein